MKMGELSAKGVQTSIGKTNQEISFFEAGLLSLIGATLIHTFSPDMDFYAQLLFWAGSGSTVAHVVVPKNKWKDLFEECGLCNKSGEYPRKREKKRTSYGYCMRFSIPKGLTTDDFERKQLAIEQHLGNRVKIKYKYTNALIEVYEKDLQDEYPFTLIESKGLEIPFAYTFGEKIVKLDFEEEPHLLLAGITNAGKSTILRIIISTLMLRGNIFFHLLDLKTGVEFQAFENSKYVKNFAINAAQAESVINYVTKEVTRRYKLFYENEVNDIKAYNKKCNPKLNHEFLIIDEYSKLRGEKESVELLITLASEARACGIHIIASTQRPSAKVISGDLKANLSTIVGLKTTNRLNSEIVIDHGGLEKVKGKGNGILRTFKDETEFQAMNLKFEEAKELIKHTYIEKKKKKQIKEKKTDGEVKSLDFMQKLK